MNLTRHDLEYTPTSIEGISRLIDKLNSFLRNTPSISIAQSRQIDKVISRIAELEKIQITKDFSYED